MITVWARRSRRRIFGKTRGLLSPSCTHVRNGFQYIRGGHTGDKQIMVVDALLNVSKPDMARRVVDIWVGAC
jgi:hypothetical protein